MGATEQILEYAETQAYHLCDRRSKEIFPQTKASHELQERSDQSCYNYR